MREQKDGIYNHYIKRILDFAISLTALIILSPLMLLLTIVGAIAMKGNPFFIQPRPGMRSSENADEKIFNLLKFRTMTNAKDEEGNLLPSVDRLTTYGRFMRKYSLDELPQLVNVLRADCSLVGPRPLLVKYLPLYSERHRRRHDVKPGLTGYAQAHGRNAVSWEEKFEMDVWYVENVSFKTDLRIIVDTLRVVLEHKGIGAADSEIMKEYTGEKEKGENTLEVSV